MVEITNIQVTDADPVTEPVTLADVKAWLAIDFDDHDDLLTGMITSAREVVETHSNLALVDKTVIVDVELSQADTVVLPYTKDVTIVTLVSLDELDQETAYTDYYKRGNQVRFLTSGRFVITYTATATTIQALKDAVKMEVAERFNNRGENNKQISQAALTQIERYSVPWL